MVEAVTGKNRNRWFVFTAAFLIIFCCAASSAFSVFAEPLRKAVNGTASQVAFTLTLYQFFMQRALDESVSYARIRSQFKRPIIRFEAVQEMLADMAIALETSQVLIHNTMTMMDQGNLVRKEGAMTKTYVTDALQRVVTDAVQVFGGYGVSKAYPVEKLMRDSKVFQIFEGTNQIQRVTIANELDKEYAGKEVGR